MGDFGASFSVKYANELGVNPKACLNAALKDLKIKQLRLMSYWDIHEPSPGIYDFKDLDWQFSLAKKYSASVSLAVGLRQPRWPESHWPQWAKTMTTEQWQKRLYKFIRAVVKRYKDHPCLESWQLENEALLKNFGLEGNFNRNRLREELKLVKQLDKVHPVIMTMSDSWGLPFRGPWPDIFAISLYRRLYSKGKYSYSRRPAGFYRLRGAAIRLMTGKTVFIHELQTEPWGPRATRDLSLEEQAITMNELLLEQTVSYARRTTLLPAYLWGTEWWYWMLVIHKDNRLWQSAKKIFTHP